MILSFSDERAEAIFNDFSYPGLPPSILKSARRKLIQLNASQQLADLRIPPGNKLEVLKGDRKGQYSIRINDQWRICLNWVGGDATQVEIVDYH